MGKRCAGTSTPDFLFSELSVTFSRSPKRSLVMNWWRVGTMPVCLLEAVSASSCSRFSRRCSSKIFCQETRMDCLASPDMALGHSIMHAMHFLCHLRETRGLRRRNNLKKNVPIPTSLSPWRLRNTSSWLSPCAGDESETETDGSERGKAFAQSAC